MKKLIILSAIFLVASLSGYAQKITEGSLSFLKAGEELNVVFNYDALMIQGSTEKEFLAEKGEEWAGQWEKAKAESYGKLFLEHMDKNLNAKKTLAVCGNYPHAPYQAIVRVLTVGRGWGIECEVVFTKTGDSAPLAKMSLIGNSRSTYGIGAPSYLTGTAFGYAGQNLGRFLTTKIK